MTAPAKQNQTELARPNGKCCVAKPGDAGSMTAASQSGVYATDDSTLDWCDEQGVRPKVGDWTMTEQWQEDLQSTDYIEGRTLKWIKELERIADLALRRGGAEPPDYELAAKILLGLVKLSSVSRQRVDLTAQIAMSSGPDLSQLTDQELKAIELGDNVRLNELARRIGKLKA
jgi:hypothetical protein